MNRDKIIRRIGDSVGVIFNKEEQAIFNIKVGEKVRISIEKYKEDTQ